MRIVLAFGVVFVIGTTCVAQKQKAQEPFPAEVVIARDSFIDVGPPFNYYDLTLLVSKGDETTLSRSA